MIDGRWLLCCKACMQEMSTRYLFIKSAMGISTGFALQFHHVVYIKLYKIITFHYRNGYAKLVL